MTTLLEHWELQSDEPDKCQWLEEAIRQQVRPPWSVKVERSITAPVGSFVVFAWRCHADLEVTAFLNESEELTLEEAVKVVTIRLNREVEGYLKKCNLPFLEVVGEEAAQARD